MLSLSDGKNAVKFARAVIESHVNIRNLKYNVTGKIFEEKLGVFVTIHTYPNHNLRGCIGIPEPVFSLRKAIIDSAKSATNDPRFFKLNSSELENIIVEVTVLTKPKLIQVENPKDYYSEIKIGRDGLIIERDFYKGLLLPQVPVEHGWDTDEFLSNTCIKAGLMPDEWIDNKTKIYKFTGQIFTELEPNGKIMEKSLNGFNS